MDDDAGAVGLAEAEGVQAFRAVVDGDRFVGLSGPSLVAAVQTAPDLDLDIVGLGRVGDVEARVVADVSQFGRGRAESAPGVLEAVDGGGVGGPQRQVVGAAVVSAVEPQYVQRVGVRGR